MGDHYGVTLNADGTPLAPYWVKDIDIADVVIVELWAPDDVECRLCGRWCDWRDGYGVPMYEDHVLPSDWPRKPDDWGAEWGGFPACRRCFLVQNDLEQPIDERDFRLIAATWFT